MPEKKAKSKGIAGRRRVTVCLDAPGAREVFLLGDFNHWDPVAHPMKKDPNGTWTKTVMLTPGSYEYKFLVDGAWCNDPANAQNCENCFGTVNNIMLVQKK